MRIDGMSKVIGERCHHFHIARSESVHRIAVVRILRHAHRRIFSEHGNGDRAAEISVEGRAIAMIVRG